jgi:hypothetical protein
MVTLWDTNYNSLDQLRRKDGTTFNTVVSRLIDLYNTIQRPVARRQKNSRVRRELHKET